MLHVRYRLSLIFRLFKQLQTEHYTCSPCHRQQRDTQFS